MIIYDFEIFKHDWLVVFENLVTEEITTIANDYDKILDYYNQNKKSVFIGYNSRHYDQYIFKAALLGMNLAEVNNWIINLKRGGWEYSKEFHKIQLFNYDIKTTTHSLKELEAFMGEDIRESSIPFDIDRKLTELELDEVEKYCTHDVKMTKEVFKHRIEVFETHLDLLKEFKLPFKYISKTETQLTAIILEAEKQERDDEFDLKLTDTLTLQKYWDIGIWYLENKDYDEHQDVMIENVPHRLGWGGIHGALENYIEEGDILHVDVESFYPNLMSIYNFLSRNVKNVKKYKTILNTRLEMKKDNPKRNAYKLVLNKTYGGSGDKYNNLYDKQMANNVCVNGQLFLVDLIEKIGNNWKLIQSNTDGLVGKVINLEGLKKAVLEWEERTGFKMGFDYFKKIVQKDINNYILIDSKGDCKRVGSYFKEKIPLDNDLPIITEALIEYFVNGVEVEQTINNCNELIKFQKVSKVTNKFDYASYGDKKLDVKCLRVFAAKEGEGVFKYKNGSKHKIGNTPEKCFIENGNIKGKLIPRKLDRQWYIDLAKKRINDVLGEGGDGLFLR